MGCAAKVAVCVVVCGMLPSCGPGNAPAGGSTTAPATSGDSDGATSTSGADVGVKFDVGGDDLPWLDVGGPWLCDETRPLYVTIDGNPVEFEADACSRDTCGGVGVFARRPALGFEETLVLHLPSDELGDHACEDDQVWIRHEEPDGTRREALTGGCTILVEPGPAGSHLGSFEATLEDPRGVAPPIALTEGSFETVGYEPISCP